MQYINQLLIILGASFLGELLNLLLPFPVPASVYGLLLLFAALLTGVVKLEKVEKTGTFLIATMSLYFIGPSVSLMTVIAGYVDSLPAVLCICFASTLAVMAVTGRVAELLMKTGDRKPDDVTGKEGGERKHE
ncbi:MAG: CidA/LrgA family protein [Lachnospiraceae bacterium]|nr:CidA/LrgA family protein [Lachnospiraceae bacterium]